MIFESRQAQRRKPSHTLVVTDVLTGQTFGYAENLSATGMGLEAATSLVEDGIYQLRFQLDGPAQSSPPIDAGVHVVWTDTAGSRGKRLGGLRFLAISEHDLDTLRRWTEMSSGNA